MKIMERIKLKVEKIVSTDLNKSNVGSDNLGSYGLQDITLRPYQLDGVQWLVERYYRKHGCILADEMGLGKTCQTISMLVFLKGSGESLGPHLVLSPLSVINNWKNELSKFAPGLKTLVYTGTKEERPALQKKMRAESDYNVVITTYEMCLKDESFFRKFSWHVLIVDEAHRLKNRQSLLHQVLREFDVDHTVLLTGTPVQNNLKELYALLSFVAPSIFRDRYLEDFVDEYSEDLTAANSSSNDMSSLHDLLKPFLLRRIKSEVVKDLPKKSEVILYHGLSTVQKTYYKAILIKDTEAFENPNKTVKTRMMNILMQLRKCVNHPYLFDGVEPEPFQLGEHLVEASGKLLLLDQLLSYLQVKGHKVLLFSQMTRMLDIVQDYLGYRGFSYERLDGSVRGEERYLAIQNFNEDDDTFIFLLSTKAGGVGLNLVAADTVIFLDSDFNPQNDLQAAARAHRIGQTRAVKVIRLVGRSTVEEIVFKRALMKLKLTNTVIEGGQFSSVTEKTDLIADDNFQMQDILKFGVDKLFETEDATLEDMDFDGMLGQTVSGEWQPEGATATPATASQTQIEVQSLEEDMNTDEPSPSMYMFEGTDYSKGTSRADQKAFNQLISVAKAEEEESFDDGRALRKHNSNLLGLLPDTSGLKKPRKQLTPEEIEARNQKRIETIARRAKQAEENKRKKREALWKANNYTSVNIELDSEGEESEEEGVEPVIGQSGDEDSEGKRQDLGYVVGDVTKPQNTTEGAIIVHCVDDSGRWGSGGLFSALGRCSARPEDQYELAGRMGDLSLGDVHLLPLYDKQNRDDGMDYCALIVAQHRDKKNNLSGIKMSALNTALIKIHKEAKKMNASVHLPRIGHNTPGFNWYGTERLLRKHLAAKGIPTYIYYYPRKHKKKRIASTDDNDSENEERSTHKVKRANTSNHSQTSGPNATSRSPSPQPSTSHEKQPHTIDKDSSGATVSEKQHSSNKSKSKSKLSDFLGGVSVNFHKLSQEVVDGYKRRVVACDGDTDEFVSATTTHIVVDPELGEDQQDDLLSILSDYPQVIVLTTTWLDDCFTQGKQLPTADYLYG